MTSLLLLLPLTLLGTADAPAPRLAVIRPMPAFQLATHSGGTLKSADLHGRVALVSFIFTTCSGSCPATTSRMVQVQQALRAKGHDNERVRLISITLDPARDTPEKLRQYMKLFDVEAASWTFLTGEPGTVDKIVAAWGMWARPAANGQLDHPSRIFLADKRGRMREIYDLAFMKPAWVVQDIELLLAEPE